MINFKINDTSYIQAPCIFFLLLAIYGGFYKFIENKNSMLREKIQFLEAQPISSETKNFVNTNLVELETLIHSFDGICLTSFKYQKNNIRLTGKTHSLWDLLVFSNQLKGLIRNSQIKKLFATENEWYFGINSEVTE